MFDPLTDAQRQNNERTDPVYLKARKAKFVHQHELSESELSNGSHANETDIIEAMNATSSPNSFFNSGWFIVVTIIVFLAAIFLTNSCLGL